MFPISSTFVVNSRVRVDHWASDLDASIVSHIRSCDHFPRNTFQIYSDRLALYKESYKESGDSLQRKVCVCVCEQERERERDQTRSCIKNQKIVLTRE